MATCFSPHAFVCLGVGTEWAELARTGSVVLPDELERDRPQGCGPWRQDTWLRISDPPSTSCATLSKLANLSVIPVLCQVLK